MEKINNDKESIKDCPMRNISEVEFRKLEIENAALRDIIIEMQLDKYIRR